MRKMDLLVAGVFFLFGLIVFVLTLFFGKGFIQDDPLGAASFPQMVALLMMLLALVFFLQLSRRKSFAARLQVFSLFSKKTRLIWIAFFLLLGYVLVLDKLGFLLATFLFNFALVWSFRMSGKLLFLLLYPPIMTTLTYLVFYKLLNVPLPPGVFYF